MNSLLEPVGETPSSASMLTCSLRSTTSTSNSSSFICFIFIITLMSYHYERRQRSRSLEKKDQKREEEKELEERQSRGYEGRFKFQETKTLMFEGVQIQQEEVERVFMDLSITIGTSIPDQVEIQPNKAFVRYPSIEVATSIYEHQKGEIQIKGKKVKIQYFPVRRVDLSLAYDWYCEKCDYKNFGRRNKCYRCDSDKTPTCRLSYSTQPSIKPTRGEESAQNCSLMLRGPVIIEVEENILLQIFQSIVPVKDIRQIKNKITGKFKDFAFIQFFSPEETTIAFQQVTQPTFRINGQKVSVMYSRNKSDDDYFKPLPYETSKRQRKTKERPQNQQDNYYHRQRQRQIEQEKARPTITMQQLKEKREQEMKKHQPVMKEISAEQSKRRQAQQLAKQWEKEMKVIATMFICPACSRKFQTIEQMKLHQTTSELHKFYMSKLQSTSLAL